MGPKGHVLGNRQEGNQGSKNQEKVATQATGYSPGLTTKKEEQNGVDLG